METVDTRLPKKPQQIVICITRSGSSWTGELSNEKLATAISSGYRISSVSQSNGIGNTDSILLTFVLDLVEQASSPVRTTREAQSL
jgi:hypothetical protein